MLVVCESPPTLDPATANGSTMIPAQVLPRLSDDVDLDLVWFADRQAEPSPEVRARCEAVVRVDVRSAPLSAAAQPLTQLPRATWQRQGGADVVRRLSERADAVYLHGLHVFGHAAALRAPVLAHEVDPWSHYWEQRAVDGTGVRAAYDRGQARRARRLERRVGVLAGRYVVVNRDDADRLGAQLDRPVDAVPNGVDVGGGAARGPGEEERDLLVFVGTLDYPPNVAAVHELCTEVLPLVRQQRPGVRLLVAGRRPVPSVLALAGPAVEVLGQVPDVRSVYARAAVAVYPGVLGRGTKNTVLEALAVGCPVVAPTQASRGVPAGDHVLHGQTPRELADQVLVLLGDDDRRRRAGRQAAVVAAGLPGWDAVAHEYEQLLRATAGG